MVAYGLMVPVAIVLHLKSIFITVPPALRTACDVRLPQLDSMGKRGLLWEFGVGCVDSTQGMIFNRVE